MPDDPSTKGQQTGRKSSDDQVAIQSNGRHQSTRVHVRPNNGRCVECWTEVAPGPTSFKWETTIAGMRMAISAIYR